MNREISILIPTFNYDAFPLVQALHREAKNLDMSYEIIVIDDGSTASQPNNSKINDIPKAHYIALSKNQGRGPVRAMLVEKASYDFVLFLDADVIPKNDDFIHRYLSTITASTDVVCGGICYAEDPPETDKMLRYTYGRSRESKSPENRSKLPWFVFTGNLLIKKELFEKVNNTAHQYYGEDLLISRNLKRANAEILHIDNPVYHLGIENSEAYLKKSLESLQGIHSLVQSGQMESDFTTLQKKYLKLKGSGLLWILNSFVFLFKGFILKNLKSHRPKIMFFDLYRLWYYSKLNKND